MQQKRKRQRKGKGSKKTEKKKEIPNYFAQRKISERKNKGKGKLNKERHKDKRRKWELFTLHARQGKFQINCNHNKIFLNHLRI